MGFVGNYAPCGLSPQTGGMPAIQYKDILLKGRPEHDKYDPFWIRHPPMPASRWAKIYAPFDALKGFNEAIQAKNLQYEEKRILDEDEQAQLNRKIRLLKELVPNSRIVRQNPVTVSVTYYIPCSDVNSDAYRCRGTYETLTGICRSVDTDVLDTIRIDQTDIRIQDIIQISFQADDIIQSGSFS